MTDESKKNQLYLLAFQAFLDNSQDMVFVKDKDLKYIAGSRPFLKLVGLENMEDVEGKTDFDIFEYDLASQYTKDDHRIFNEEISIEDYIERLPDKNGEKSYSSTSKYLIRDENGSPAGLYGVARDVTVQMQLREEQENRKLSRQMFDIVLEADLTKNEIIKMEGGGWIQQINICEGAPYTDIICELTKCHIHPDHKSEFLTYYKLESLRDSFEAGTAEFNHVTYIAVEEGYRWVEFRARVYFSEISNTLRVMIFIQDKDSEIRHRLLLQKKATTDPLTGLENRESAWNHITQFLNEDSQATHALLFIDLDYFKQVNDHWGHFFGDDVLRIVAIRLKHAFRKDDILGRIGGDEFLVLVKEVCSREKLKERVHQAIKTLSMPIVRGAVEAKITCSIGIAMCSGGETTIEALYQKADEAMYQAKKQGRQQFCFFDDL